MEPREYERSFALEEEHWWFRSKRSMVLALLRRYGRLGGRGLDVGCGTGGMLHALTRGLPTSGGQTGVDSRNPRVGGLPEGRDGPRAAGPRRPGEMPEAAAARGPQARGAPAEMDIGTPPRHG